MTVTTATGTAGPTGHDPRGGGTVPAALEGHRVELWVDERWLDQPGAQALLNLLGSAAFRERVRLIGGYDLDGCGSLKEAA